MDGMRTTLQIGESETLPPSNVVANFPFKIDCVTRYVIKCKPSGANFVGKMWGGLHSNTDLCLDENFHLHMFLKHMTLSLAHG